MLDLPINNFRLSSPFGRRRGFSPADLFRFGEKGTALIVGPNVCFQDAAGTTPAGAGDPVGLVLDTSGNGNNATQSDNDDYRPTLQTAGGLWYLDPDLIDDCVVHNISGSFSGGRAFSSPHGHQIDNNIPLAGFDTRLPNVRLPSYVAREGNFTATEIDRVSAHMTGDRQYMVTMTDDLTLANLRMEMSNAETPVVTAIGANGVEATVTLGDPSDSALDLGAAGLTAPATVLWPLVNDNTSLEVFWCHNNSLTGSIPNLSSNTTLVYFWCYSNSLTGSIPNLSSNTNLVVFWCHNNSLTGSIPNLSSNTTLVYFWCYSNSLTGSIPNLSSNTNLVVFWCHNNSLTGSIPNLSSNTTLVYFWCYSNSLTGWAGGTLPVSLDDFRAQNNDLPEATVDALLAALDTAGASNGDCKLEGGTNAAPSSAGETSIDNLRGKGWTVTVTGGY
ncbi:leucine-rich repeat domain-containing protein [Roseovarius sp.]|uniref:leucine-rich repeat domain-containing protein n=1 Tax=Roseovarius sp. TaxID=1486281 RepID=UPI003BABB6F1